MKSDYIFYTYRCKSCTRIVTKLQVLDLMSGKSKGGLCSCGGSQIAPSDLTGTDYLLPRVWKLVLHILTGRLAPPPEPSRPVVVEPLRPIGGGSA